MEAFLEQIQHLRIGLGAVESATNNFDERKVIGRGGFGKVYEGMLYHSKVRRMAAFKRLNRDHGQGDSEFWKEILMLSRFTHENVISLLGFCDENGEKIIVYEHASRGSLDRHLGSFILTWRQRLNICLTAATGLCYLHDPNGTQERAIHRDIKSSNILLDENWNAKVADMGLSKIGPANQSHSFLPTNPVGTPGYIDPLYLETSSLTKESDVYSFGVVLLEVLCGRLCFERNNNKFDSLVPTWKKSYKEKKLNQIIFRGLKQEMDPRSLDTFSDIAYRCLHELREERPKMSDVVEKLGLALHFQEMSEEVEPPMDYEDMIMSAVAPQDYRSEEDTKMLLSEGILLSRDRRYRWFLLTKNGEHCEMIAAEECLIPIPESYYYFDHSEKESRFRFEAGYKALICQKFKADLKTQYLSPNITYAVNLVFHFYNTRPVFFCLNYKLAGETKFSNLYFVEKREDGWLMAELYIFISNRRKVDLEIMFECKDLLVVEGIEFLPVEKVEHQVSEDDEVDMQIIPHSETYWEQKLPSDYEDIIKWSKDSLQWTTKIELYSILRKGFLIRNGDQWFSLAKNGKKCHLLSAKRCLERFHFRWGSSPESRFQEVAFDLKYGFSFSINCKSSILSPQTTYACYLVYKIERNHFRFEHPVKVRFNGDLRNISYIYLVSPKTPVIRPKVYQNTHIILNRPKEKGFPQQRDDGWMEVQVHEFQTGTTTEGTLRNLQLLPLTEKFFSGIIVLGIEFKPL